MDWQTYLSLAALVSFLITGAGMWYGMFRKASRQENTDIVSSSKDLIDFWRDQAEGYKVMLAEKETSWNTKFETLTREIGVLQGQLNATETQRAQFEAILKDRNPETEQFMKDVAESMHEIKNFMQTINLHMEKGYKVESVVTPDGKK